MRTKTFLLLLPLSGSIGLWIGHQSMIYQTPKDERSAYDVCIEASMKAPGYATEICEPLGPWVDDAGLEADSYAPQEDEAGWNCYTMGNRDCGPDWTLWRHYETMPGHFTDCMAKVGDTTILHCADGLVTTT